LWSAHQAPAYEWLTGTIAEYLNNINADIENYRFAVEKTDNGLTIDVMFKATVSTRP
jgi:hypothetical protein